MKTIIKSGIPFLLLAFFFYACKPEEDLLPRLGKVTFSFAPHARSSNGGRVNDTSVPAFVLLSIIDSEGITQENIKIPLFAFGQSFLSENLNLQTDSYQLTAFAVLDTDNKIIYATPREGSDLAKYVAQPLPLDFTIVENLNTQIIPQVLAVSTDDTPESFGLASFGFEIVEAKFNFTTTVTIADNNQHESIDYAMEVTAKDVALGSVKWTGVYTLNGTDTISVPARYGHYTFKVTKSGYLPHVQHFLVTELSEHQNLSFEFLPETLDGFIVHELGNGALKLYLPNDQNRCKLYARADVAEGFRIEYLYVDRSASAISGVSVADLILAVCLPEIVSASACGKNVNLFGNTPFGMAQDYCAEVDLTISSYTHSIEDVNIESYTYFDFYKPGNTVPEQDAVHHLWKGANNP
jgi:hypothetical protein